MIQITKKHLIIVGVLIILTTIFLFYLINTSSRNVTPTSAPTNQLTYNSPSQKFSVRYSTESKTGLELVTPTKPIQLFEEIGVISILNSNIAWTTDESLVVISYLVITEDRKEIPYLAIFSTTTGNLLNKNTLDQGSYYGINNDHTFPPIISPNNKLIAIQTDLIHQISIYSIDGKFLKNIPTKYYSIPLFSPEMYTLENGKYSPFLEYHWSPTGDQILYRFQGSETFYTLSVNQFLN